MQLLLVEDDHALAAALSQALQGEGHVVNHVGSGEAALYLIETETPDIVILDLGLPDRDGLEVLRRARKNHVDLPILVLTARAGLDDRIMGLDSGADDYLPKPFEMAELFARLRVLERRLSTAKSAQISIAGVTLDINKNSVTFNGQELALPRREYMLLRSLMENAGRIQTRHTLENRLYSWGEEVASNALEVHIHHLRKKLGSDFIQTVRGVGYRIRAT